MAKETIKTGSGWAAALGIIGGIMMLIAGAIAAGLMSTLNSLLSQYGLTWAQIGVDPNSLNVSCGLTFLWGVIAIAGGVAAYNAEYVGVGSGFLLIFGLIAVIGEFVPIATIQIGSYSASVTLSSSLIYIDPFLVLIGGFAGLAFASETTPAPQSPPQRAPPQPREEAYARMFEKPEQQTPQPQSGELQVNEGELAAEVAIETFGDKLEAAYKAESAINTERREAIDSQSTAQITALQDEVKRLEADLAFDREVIAAKEARIAEQGKEIEQLKAFITKVSDRVAQPQTPPAPLPQSKGRCVRCGFQNIREAKYCRQCGTRVES